MPPEALAVTQILDPAPDDAGARLYVALGRIVRMLRRTGTADISPGAFAVLAALNTAGPLRSGDLAALPVLEQLARDDSA